MRMPAIFVGHGTPMNAIDDNNFTRVWQEIGKRFTPKGILMISAHWYVPKTVTQDASQPEQIYDMYGFPEELYQLKYPVHGDLDLTGRIQAALGDAVAIDNSWGIDHGAWSVLVHMYPKANIPVVQLSVNRSNSPQQQFDLGAQIAHLRDEGYLIIASGNIVHNLRMVNFAQQNPFDWAIKFDDYVENAIKQRDYDQCINFKQNPAAQFAVPTPDHYYPLLTLLGAVAPQDEVTVFNKAYAFGSLSMTGYLFE